MNVKKRLNNLGWKSLKHKNRYVSSEGFYLEIKSIKIWVEITASLDEDFTNCSETFVFLSGMKNLDIIGDDKSLFISGRLNQAIHVGALEREESDDLFAWVIGSPKEAYIAKSYADDESWAKLCFPENYFSSLTCSDLYYVEEDFNPKRYIYRGIVRFCIVVLGSMKGQIYINSSTGERYIGTNSNLAVNLKYFNNENKGTND